MRCARICAGGKPHQVGCSKVGWDDVQHTKDEARKNATSLIASVIAHDPLFPTHTRGRKLIFFITELSCCSRLSALAWKEMTPIHRHRRQAPHHLILDALGGRPGDGE